MDRGFNVLIIEEDSDDARIIQRALQSRASVVIHSKPIRSISEAMDRLRFSMQKFDAIVLDLNLDDPQQWTGFRQLVAMAVDTPLIVLSAQDSEELAIKVMAEGAQDFIAKSELASGDFVQKVRYAVERQRLVNEINRAKNALSRMTEYKSQFLAQMSHEIRTPLNGVIGNISLLTNTELDRSQAHLVGSIRESGDLLLRRINDILDISRFESGGLEFKYEKTQIRNLVDSLVASQAEKVQAPDLILTSYIDPRLEEWVQVDGFRIRQILEKLIANSLQFTDRGCICVKVLEPSKEEGLRFEVSDTGRGIPEDKLANIFIPYMERPSSDQFYGIGLGLVICKFLVEQMRGTIGAESREGAGSTFWFTLPCERFQDEPVDTNRREMKSGLLFGAEGVFGAILQDQLRAGNLQTRSLPSEAAFDDLQNVHSFDFIVINSFDWSLQQTKFILGKLQSQVDFTRVPVILFSRAGNVPAFDLDPRCHIFKLPLAHSALLASLQKALQGPTTKAVTSEDQNPSLEGFEILLVDDVAANIRIIEKMLTLLKIKAASATSGQEAIDLCAVRSFDMILMDCRMPGLSGYETAHIIRHSLGAKTPIIAVSANSAGEDSARLLESGMNDALAKPLKFEDLTRILRKWLNPPLPGVAAAPGQASINGNEEEPSLLDLQTLAMLKSLEKKDDPEPFLAGLIATYCEETPELVESLANALQENQVRGIEHFAHKLKGFSRNMGLMSLAQFCFQVEESYATLTEAERLAYSQSIRPLHAASVKALIHFSAKN